MAKVKSVTTVPGSRDGRGNRKVVYTFVKDDGDRETHTLDVSGNRQRVAQLIAAFHGIDVDDVEFDANYDD